MSSPARDHTSEPARRILVVDDNDASRYATVRILRGAGFEIMEATTGSEVQPLARAGVDLVVLDVNLPDIDGFQVCAQLRAHRETAHLPICYLSATFTESADVARGMSSGGDSYLTHPAEPAVLVATVRALIFAQDAQAQRRAADARVRALLDLAPNGIAMLDAALRFTDANPALCKLLGHEREDLIGRPLRSVIGEDRGRELQELSEALRQNHTWHGVLPAPQAAGAAMVTEWQITPDTGTGASIAMISDITARQQLERERERALAGEQAARAEAERSNQLKDEFLATLSHELRNPLNAILGWSEVLMRMPGVPAEIARGIAAIDRNSRIQSHLISDLLDFAGIRFGKMRLEKKLVDANQALRAAVEVVSGQAESKGVELRLQPLERTVSLLADEARLQQVFWNLLTNAVKFTPQGGRVEISARQTGASLEVIVRDTGRGISPEFLPRLFDRFSQQDSGSSRNFSGLGIGLTIVRHLVTMHGGTISVASQGVGRGATFTVRFPLAGGDALVQMVAGERPLQGVRVLIVEDMDDTRELVNRVLSDAGAQVHEAASVQEALAAVASQAPHVLVSDLGMPRSDGYQLIRTLRSQGYSAQALPALALTAFARTEDRSGALEAGFQLHLSKPINAEVLVAAVMKLARGRATVAPGQG